MASSFFLGVNLSGAEFGSNVPGVFGTDYTYPTHAEIDYYASKGLGVIRLPFLWERMQHTEFGTLDPTELGRLTDVVNYATSKGLKIEIEPHDYGYGFGALIGSTQTPNSAFADFWGKLAQHFVANANVIFGLMNEPHDQSATAWVGSANAAIAAIRSAGAVSQEILVPGSYWDGAWTWTSTDNASVVGTGVQDPAHDFAFEVHQYLDSDGSGTHSGAVSATIGVERLTAITQWAEATGNHLFLGEVGVTTDQTSLTALDGMLTYMLQHTDAWQGATYWAGGPWWGNYMFSIEPQNGVDKPQMAILVRHEAALVDTAPVVTVNSSSILASRSNPVAASALFTATDQDGDSIVQYDFWGSGNAGGHWLLNNGPLPNGTDNFVSAAQLSQVTYQGGAGTETIWVRASDGLQYSTWKAINATNTAPTVTVPNPNVTVNHFIPVAASTLFTAADADTDGIAQYDFWDYGTTGSTWLLNGTPLLLGHDNFVDAAQLSKVSYRAGAGTETIWERASDGLQFGAWVSLNATGTESAPVVTPTSPNVTVSHQTPVSATSLFSASDADGDSIVQYDFWDSGQAGGHWLLNGVALPNSLDNFVNAGQLSQVTYRGGAGTDTIWERASDGIQFGAWASINATDTPPVTTQVQSQLSAVSGMTFAATSLFTAADGDGDGIAQYDFWDNGQAGGHWFNGNTQLFTNADNFVPASQLSQVTYHAGTGTEVIWARASDGLQFGAWPTGMTVYNALVANPVSNSRVTTNHQTIAATSLVTVTDASGLQITQYDVWNTGSGGGHWNIGATVLGTNGDNFVSTSQFSQLTYTPGNGTDTLWVRARDANGYGPWSVAFTVSDPPQQQTVGSGETMEVASPFSGSVTFAGPTGRLKLDDSSSFTGTVAGLCGQDGIDLADIGFGTSSTLGYSANADSSGGTLSVGDGTHMANIALLGSYTASSFVSASDGHGGTLISETAQSATQMPTVTQPHA